MDWENIIWRHSPRALFGLGCSGPQRGLEQPRVTTTIVSNTAACTDSTINRTNPDKIKKKIRRRIMVENNVFS